MSTLIFFDFFLNYTFLLLHRRRNRLNPLDIPNEFEFKSRYRFNKESIQEIVELTSPFITLKPHNRGLPCSVEQIVCTGLEVVAGGHFFRVAGYGNGVCTTTASVF